MCSIVRIYSTGQRSTEKSESSRRSFISGGSNGVSTLKTFHILGKVLINNVDVLDIEILIRENSSIIYFKSM